MSLAWATPIADSTSPTEGAGLLYPTVGLHGVGASPYAIFSSARRLSKYALMPEFYLPLVPPEAILASIAFLLALSTLESAFAAHCGCLALPGTPAQVLRTVFLTAGV